ncbi:hypothetical protein [Ekhidna sp.]|uniref:hypothetical protein n=1 Tax=Ekhidna sp. TaxID=2608089 RepID=UPI003C7BB56C
MRKVALLFISLSQLFIFSCGEDETCGLNGQVNGECFQVVLDSYDIQTLSSNGVTYTRENIFFAIQFDNGSERYGIRARSNQYNNQRFSVGGQNYRFEIGKDYDEDSMTFNGDMNAPATGVLTVTFSKVDRANGLMSGSFVWNGQSTGATTSTLSGTFTDVAVALEN